MSGSHNEQHYWRGEQCTKGTIVPLLGLSPRRWDTYALIGKPSAGGKEQRQLEKDS